MQAAREFVLAAAVGTDTAVEGDLALDGFKYLKERDLAWVTGEPHATGSAPNGADELTSDQALRDLPQHRLG